MIQSNEWTAVDHYLTEKLVPPDTRLEDALAASTAAGLPAINVSPNQGKMLELLARVQGARRILEIGTLGGYSTIWLARALPPNGKLLTLESEQKHAEVARRNLGRAGFSGKVQVCVGPAAESLADLVARGEEAFDFIFIDADKQSYAEYFMWAIRLSRRGTLIVADNIVRQGAVWPTPPATTNACGACNSSSTPSPPNPGSARRRCRPWAARATMGLRSRW